MGEPGLLHSPSTPFVSFPPLFSSRLFLLDFPYNHLVNPFPLNPVFKSLVPYFLFIAFAVLPSLCLLLSHAPQHWFSDLSWQDERLLFLLHCFSSLPCASFNVVAVGACLLLPPCLKSNGTGGLKGCIDLVCSSDICATVPRIAEEINHAGSGGIWSELVSNRGFEHVNDSAPNPLDPWLIVGDEDSVRLSTDNSSCFDRNKVALRMKVYCDITCPHGGVGVYNPGFWGMNIEKGKTYKLIFYLRAANLSHDLEMKASLTSPDGLQTLESADIFMTIEQAKKWTKVEHTFKATASNTTARLQFTTNRIGSYWLDQVSLMPTDTHKGHGFRRDLYAMLENLSPSFMRFLGGTYVQGKLEENRFRWKESIGPCENKPGHFNDNWNYWTDDALGYYELLLALVEAEEEKQKLEGSGNEEANLYDLDNI